MMTPEQIQILQHSLGADEYGRGTRWRNHFCTGEGSDDHPHCMALVEQGFMTRRAAVKLYGGDDLFHVTDAGITAMMIASPAPPKLSRSKQRYQRFLDLDCSMSFGEFLKSSYADMRSAR